MCLIDDELLDDRVPNKVRDSMDSFLASAASSEQTDGPLGRHIRHRVFALPQRARTFR